MIFMMMVFCPIFIIFLSHFLPLSRFSLRIFDHFLRNFFLADMKDDSFNISEKAPAIILGFVFGHFLLLVFPGKSFLFLREKNTF
jgi:hypothetical protein